MGLEKRCRHCNIVKSEDQFFKNKSSADKLQYWCKPCQREKQRAYRQTPRGRALSKAWHGKNKHKRAEYEKRYFAKISFRNKEKWLKRKYGLTFDQFSALLASQGNKCPICLDTNPEGKEQIRWNVDHDHKTGKIRAILCGICNRTLGIAQESLSRLEGCIAYLKFHGGMAG